MYVFFKDCHSASEMLHQIFHVPEPVKRNLVLNSMVGYPQTRVPVTGLLHRHISLLHDTDLT